MFVFLIVCLVGFRFIGILFMIMFFFLLRKFIVLISFFNIYFLFLKVN